MHLSGLFIYPVKSLKGFSVREARVDALGLADDRRFLVADEKGRFLTQRTHPRMALVETALDGELLTLSAAGHGSVQVRKVPDPAATTRTVSVWSSEGLQAEACGEEAARWLSRFLGTDCGLVRIGAAFRRPIPAKKVPQRLLDTDPTVSFADGFPFLLLGEASLEDLNRRLATAGSPAVPLDRFRANLVVAGPAPYEEDTWRRFRLGEMLFHSGGPCARCVVTTTNQETAERGPEPLRTLACYRRNPAKPSDVLFGVNLIHETREGTLRVGDTLAPLEAGPPAVSEEGR